MTLTHCIFPSLSFHLHYHLPSMNIFLDHFCPSPLISNHIFSFNIHNLSPSLVITIIKHQASSPVYSQLFNWSLTRHSAYALVSFLHLPVSSISSLLLLPFSFPLLPFILLVTSSSSVTSFILIKQCASTIIHNHLLLISQCPLNLPKLPPPDPPICILPISTHSFYHFPLLLLISGTSRSGHLPLYTTCAGNFIVTYNQNFTLLRRLPHQHIAQL